MLEFPDLENSAKKLLDSGIPHLDVAERFNLPLILIHAIDLHGRDDQERMKRLNITLQPYDVWNFARCDDLYGSDWPGRSSPNLLHTWNSAADLLPWHTRAAYWPVFPQ